MSDSNRNERRDWFASMLTRREANERLAGTAAVVAGALTLGGTVGCNKSEDNATENDALELQKEQGWNVGYTDSDISLTGVQETNSLGNDPTPFEDPQALIDALQTRAETWREFESPVLFQSLDNGDLKDQIQAIHTPEMQTAYQRGQALAELVGASEDASSTLVLLDIPGPESVATAAGMSTAADPVFFFDNWPHPAGVVDSASTLAAAIYYAEELQTNRDAVADAVAPTPTDNANTPGAAPVQPLRGPDGDVVLNDAGEPLAANLDGTAMLGSDGRVVTLAQARAGGGDSAGTASARENPILPADARATVLVLDSNRLTPYTDADNQFDNRYMALPPEASDLQSRGITRVLYIGSSQNASVESDDLNDVMVEYANAGITTTYMGMDVFGEENGRQYYGGSSSTHGTFYRHYPIFIWWRSGPYYGGRSFGMNGTPRTPARASGYTPRPRTTMFSSRTTGGNTSGVGRTRPTGFGRVTTRTGANGATTVRSGSIGRMNSSGVG